LPSIDIDSYYEQTSTLCFFLTLCKLQRNCVASNKKKAKRRSEYYSK
jgi:hypothetical protein